MKLRRVFLIMNLLIHKGETDFLAPIAAESPQLQNAN
jgi:hypothetical protein